MALITPKNIETSKLSDGSNFLQDLPAGSVLQVISNVMDGDSYIGSSSYIHLTDLTTTITPRSATSKIFCTMQISISAVSRYHSTKLYRSIGGGSDVQIANCNIGSTSRQPAWMVLGMQ